MSAVTAAPAAINAQEPFTFLEMEAALCVWECLNDWTLLDDKSSRPDWIELREDLGSCELRNQSVVLGRWCLAVHALCTADDRDFFDGIAFDWEVIPEILSHARNADGPVIYAEGLPAPETIAPLVTTWRRKNEWLRKARDEAARIWAYADIITDHEDAAESAFELGEDPKAFAKAIGEKYDLTSAVTW